MLRNLSVSLLLSLSAIAQPAFDAASVKPASNEIVPGSSFLAKGGPGTSDPGRITYTQLPLITLLIRAYDVHADQISGPPWLTAPNSSLFTVIATMPPTTTTQQFQLMLQQLLIERFQMKVHHETRPFPGYELVVAAAGPNLKPTMQAAEAVAPERTFPPTPPKLGPDGKAILPPGPQSVIGMGGGAMRAQFQDRSMAEILERLGFMVSRALGNDASVVQPRVVDKTGLTGRYDFNLDVDCPGCVGITPAMRANMPLLAGRGGGGDAPTPETASDPGSGLPNIFNAVEKQLGLRLVKVASIPVDIVVIDKAEKTPLEN